MVRLPAKQTVDTVTQLNKEITEYGHNKTIIHHYSFLLLIENQLVYLKNNHPHQHILV